MKTKAIRFDHFGGPEVLRFEEVDVQDPGPGEVRIRHGAIGINYIDTYHRTGLYPVPLPSGLGLEAAGVVEALGAGVTSLKVGDRVAYGTGAVGAYSQVRNYPANRLVKLPDNIADETAAAMMLKGMTARFLVRAAYVVKPGETILLHAAAGGVGQIVSQWAKALGARVIGVVGSEGKVATARANGCDVVIDSSKDSIVQRVRDETKGQGVPVVYDGVGQATVMQSLDCLQPRGLLVCFGNASGPVKNFDLGLLAAKGSLYLTRPTLNSYVAKDADFAETSQDLVDAVSSGKVRIDVNQRYALADAAQAHRDLEGRKTIGASVLMP